MFLLGLVDGWLCCWLNATLWFVVKRSSLVGSMRRVNVRFSVERCNLACIRTRWIMVTHGCCDVVCISSVLNGVLDVPRASFSISWIQYVTLWQVLFRLSSVRLESLWKWKWSSWAKRESNIYQPWLHDDWASYPFVGGDSEKEKANRNVRHENKYASYIPSEGATSARMTNNNANSRFSDEIGFS